MDKSVITRAVTVAGGRLVRGHLGELTQQVPFEMVEGVLQERPAGCSAVPVISRPAWWCTCCWPAACSPSWDTQVWRRLTAGLAGLPAAAAMTQARRRLGPGPLRELFFLLRGPAPAGARWRGCWSARSTAPSCPSRTARRTWPSTQSSAAGATETPSASGIYQAVTRRGRQCGVGVWPHRFRHHFSHTWLERGGPEGDLMELNGWSIPQMLARYGASARSARVRRTYDRVMTGNPCALALDRQSRRARTDGHRDTKDPPFWH